MKIIKYVKKNLPTILTVSGAIGVVTTSVAAIKGNKKYEQLMSEQESFTTQEYAKVCIEAYALPVLSGLATISCIVGANRISVNREAALTGAYLFLDNKYKQYRTKVIETIDEDKDKEIIRSIAEDELERYDIQHSYDGDVNLYYDPISNQYFEMTEADLLRAEYATNRYMMEHKIVELNRFYERLNIDQSDFGSVLGWCTKDYNHKDGVDWIEIEHVPMVLDDGLVCYMLGYQVEPSPQFLY